MPLPIGELEANFDRDGHKLLCAPPNRGTESQRVAILELPTSIARDSLVAVQECPVQRSQVGYLNLLENN